MARRAFLLLQGVCSPFFARLADELQAAGHAVLKLNFNAGDALYWARRPGWHFRGTLDELGEFLETRYARHGITDQVMFGDCRPVHRCASACAARNGVRTHVFEEGYFRPYWITLESEGANGRSRLPRDPGWFRHVARLLPPTPVEARFAAPYRVRAFHDVAYHVAGSLNPILYPHYRTHSATTAPLEYAAYVRRLAWLKKFTRKTAPSRFWRPFIRSSRTSTSTPDRLSSQRKSTRAKTSACIGLNAPPGVFKLPETFVGTSRRPPFVITG